MPRRLLLLAALLALGCSDLMLFRAGQDYFPLVKGSLWKYLLDGDTTYVEVMEDSSVGGQPATVVAVDFVPGFWLKKTPATRVLKFFRNVLSRGGMEYELEARYGLVYLLPFVEGDTWSDVYRNTVVVQGNDTLDYLHSLQVHVAGVEDITTPAGSFDQCYRLEITERVEAEETTVNVSTEWLAPGVGVVRRLSGTTEQVLASYRIGP